MEHRVAMISIIAQETEGVEQLNALLHEYAPYIIGRMGIPYRQLDIPAKEWFESHRLAYASGQVVSL